MNVVADTAATAADARAESVRVALTSGATSPVLVYLVHGGGKPVRLHRDGPVLGEIRRRVDKAADALGIRAPFDVVIADAGDMGRPAMPRGLSWNLFPIIGAPQARGVALVAFRHWRRDEGGWRDHLDANPAGPEFASSRDIVASARFIALDPTPVCGVSVATADGMAIAAAALHLDAIGMDGKLAVFVDGEGNVWDSMEWGEAKAVAARLAGAQLRLAWQYAVNFTSIAAKALVQVGRDHYPRAAELWAKGRFRSLSNPLALQVLYKAAESGLWLVDDPVWLRADPERRRLMPNRYRLAALEGTEAVREGVRLWKGTGKHRGAEVLESTLTDIANDLALAKLVAVDPRTGKAFPSAMGRALLDLLHPDCWDVDLPCRWLDKATGLWRSDCDGSVDEWTRRYFGRLKTRLDSMGA